MIIRKSPAEIETLRVSARLAREVLETVAERVAPGVTTGELDAYALELMRARGAVSAFFGYRGYPGQICVSVNDEVVHGVPGSRRVQLGDMVSLDVGVTYGGFVGDTAKTVLVGVTDPEWLRLARVGEDALEAAIAAARPGNRLGDISHAIEKTAKAAGYSVVRDFVGHGVGRKLHEDPPVPNYGSPGKGPRLRRGMTLALEPMINAGRHAVKVMDDGWTVRTVDGMPSVHFEHIVAITDGEADVLTRIK